MPKQKEQLWFKARPFGWGWYPSSWQGWGITIAFIAGLLGLGMRIDNIQPEESSEIVIQFLLPLAVMIALLISIAYKTGEKPEWRWGGKKVSPTTARTLSLFTTLLIVLVLATVITALFRSS